MGVRKMRVLSAPWKKLTGLAGFGLEVVEYIDAHGDKKEDHD
jgi:GTP cyclohydrolase II